MTQHTRQHATNVPASTHHTAAHPRAPSATHTAAITIATDGKDSHHHNGFRRRASPHAATNNKIARKQAR